MRLAQKGSAEPEPRGGDFLFDDEGGEDIEV
jgi:hypothetical protein